MQYRLLVCILLLVCLSNLNPKMRHLVTIRRRDTVILMSSTTFTDCMSRQTAQNRDQRGDVADGNTVVTWISSGKGTKRCVAILW